MHVPELAALETRMAERFSEHLALLGIEVPAHDVSFSRRLTSTWAMIYLGRCRVRISPYVFLLPEDALPRGSHWREIDATLAHEAAHAACYALSGESGHTPLFHALLARLGVESHGPCDLGPALDTQRYEYGCDACGASWRLRRALTHAVSCGRCGSGRFDARYTLRLRRDAGHPWQRLDDARDTIARAIREAGGAGATAA